jgi:hypothetical protein
MKKLLGIVVLGLLLSGNAHATKVKLVCQGLLQKIEGHNFYINFDDKTIDVFQGAYGNKLTFKVKRNDDYWVISHLRSLLKGDTSYDTHVTDWINWDSEKHKYHLYEVQIDRINGMAIIMRSKKPYKEGKTKYKLVPLGATGMECKKLNLSGKF